jgi:hypothetical protein
MPPFTRGESNSLVYRPMSMKAAPRASWNNKKWWAVQDLNL